MKREMWITPGHVQRFAVWVGLGSFLQHKMSSSVLDGQEFSTRAEATAYLDRAKQDIKDQKRPQFQGWHDIQVFSRPARSPGEVTEATAWQRLQQVENNTVDE